MKYINFVDFEATDKNPATAEILTGYVETHLEENLEAGINAPVDSLYIECRPVKYLEESFRFHKITRERAMAFPDPRIGMRAFYTHLLKYPNVFVCHANHVVFGITGYFDWQLLRSFCNQRDQSGWFFTKFRNWEVRSTHTMAKAVTTLPVDGYALDKLAKHFCINFDHHNCIQDVKAMVKIYIELKKHRTLFDFMEV